MSKPKKIECSICVENVSESKILKCPYCEYEACIECHKHMFLDSINEPACANCKKTFSKDLIYQKMPKTFMEGPYKKHRQDLLFAIEMARLPATQPHVAQRKRKTEIANEIADLRESMKRMKERITELTFEYHRADLGLEDKSEKEAETFIGPCPNEECRGFLSTRHKCGTCGVNACSDCRCVKNDEHKCDPDTVATVIELKKTCRNCPNCMAPIFKVNGCDQMYCTKKGCGTAFNWKTGKVEKGIIHNPHYFEMLRQQGDVPRNPYEVRCGGMPNPMFINDRRLRVKLAEPIFRYGQSFENLDLFLRVSYQKILHTRQVDMARLPTHIDNQTNLDLRIDYLEEIITSEKFKTLLQRREKDRAKKLEYRDILETYSTVMQDIFTRLSENFDISSFIIEEDRISSYIGVSILKLSEKYNAKLRSPYDI